MKNKEVNAIELRKTKGAKKRQGSQLRIELLHYLHVHSRTLIATPTPSCHVHILCMLVGTTLASKECGQIREKIQLTFKSTADQEECACSSYYYQFCF